MAVSPAVVDAYVRRYTQTQLETALDQALSDLASGVQVTSVTFDGGGASGQKIEGGPAYLVEHLEEALKRLADDDRTAQQRPMSVAMDFSGRQFGT